ncbi:uncharacterized protein LOC110357928 isoform X2 [Columba livia]|uniref:uncharacterized protein LOC110357928 isoform X2 n=1 Tax=Columba livia TaxID=8932 RepID=UPI0031BBA759
MCNAFPARERCVLHSGLVPLSEQRTGGRRGKWARRALHGGWQRGSRSTCPGCREGERSCAACVPPLRISLVRAGVEGNHPRPVLPPTRILGPAVSAGTAVRVSMHIDAHTRSDTAPHLSSRSDHGTPACMAEVQSNFDRKDRSERTVVKNGTMTPFNWNMKTQPSGMYGNMPACLKQITLCDYSANVRKSSVTFMVNFLVDRSLSTFKECESMVLWKLPAS